MISDSELINMIDKHLHGEEKFAATVKIVCRLSPKFLTYEYRVASGPWRSSLRGAILAKFAKERKLSA